MVSVVSGLHLLGGHGFFSLPESVWGFSSSEANRTKMGTFCIWVQISEFGCQEVGCWHCFATSGCPTEVAVGQFIAVPYPLGWETRESDWAWTQVSWMSLCEALWPVLFYPLCRPIFLIQTCPCTLSAACPCGTCTKRVCIKARSTEDPRTCSWAQLYISCHSWGWKESKGNFWFHVIPIRGA